MYHPEEDSYLLSEALSNYLENIKNPHLKALDMGTGSGIQAETLSRFIDKKNILCTDIDDFSLNHVRKKGFKVLTSNLFSKIQGKWDLISFNPPYLPRDNYDNKKDTTGGKKGDEVILRFLKQAKSHLAENGKIFLLLSSLTPRKKILKLVDKAEIVASQSLFFETLEVWSISF